VNIAQSLTCGQFDARPSVIFLAKKNCPWYSFPVLSLSILNNFKILLPKIPRFNKISEASNNKNKIYDEFMIRVG